MPANREDIWLPEGEGEDAAPGATPHPARIPAELSDSAFFTDRALTYLKGRDGKPFFLHLGYYRPHPPFVASAPYHAMYSPDSMAPPVRAATPEQEAAQHPLLGWYLRNTNQAKFFRGGQGMAAAMDEATVRQLRATYLGMMTEVDDCLGRVFAYLDETGQWDDTLIVFTSDHGEQLGDHHLLGKIGYFDESFRIPLVIKQPGNPRAGQVEAAFTESVDVMPTVLEWLGGEAPRACDGRSACCRCWPAAARRIGAPSCTMNTTSATCTTARRRPGWACTGTRAACAWCRMPGGNTSTSPPCRRCCSTWRRTRTSSATWPRTPPMLPWCGTTRRRRCPGGCATPTAR